MSDDNMQDVNKKKLFVGNLPFSVTQEEMQELFSEHGEVVEVNLITDRMSGRSKGFGFVEYATEEEAAAAVEAMSGSELDGRELVVNIARPKAPRRSFGGGDRGGYNRNRGGYDRNRGGGGRSYDRNNSQY